MLRALVLVPTYNERDSLESVVHRLLVSDTRIEVLVIDDASPDGTGDIADRLAAEDARVQVLHRSGKNGLGSAYLAGFRVAAERGFDALVEFDADGSHQPEQLPGLLDAIEGGADLVIGTRWMPGGRIENWPLHRRIISRAGTWYARILLRSKLRDITSGYRAFRTNAVESLDLTSAHSHGYAFQIELAWLVERAGRPIAEVPITFVERASGSSKMTPAIVVEAALRVTKWGLRGR